MPIQMITIISVDDKQTYLDTYPVVTNNPDVWAKSVIGSHNIGYHDNRKYVGSEIEKQD